MIVNIYSAECVLYRVDDICCRWTIHRFYPIFAEGKPTERGFVVETSPRPLIRIKSHFATLSEDMKWLKLVNKKTYDAGTILLMARNGHELLELLDPPGKKG